MTDTNRANAEAVLAAVRVKFAAYLGDGAAGPVIYPGSHEGLQTPGAFVISWEEGPFEWSYGALDDTAVDVELTAEVQDVAPGGVIRSKAVPIPPGVFLEAVNHWCLGVYPDGPDLCTPGVHVVDDDREQAELDDLESTLGPEIRSAPAHPKRRAPKPAPGHVFTFEMWPPDAGERTLPGRTSRIDAQSPSEARAAAAGQLPAGGWTLGAGSHIRSACQPPHSGSDALAAPGSNQVWHATALAETRRGEVLRMFVAEWWPGGRVTLHSENPRRPNAAVSRRWVRQGADPGTRAGWTVSDVEAAAHYPSPEAFEAAFGAAWGLVRAFERASSMLPAGAPAWDFADAEAASMRDEPEDDCAICAPGTCPGGSKCPGSLDTTPVLVTLSWPDTDPDRGSETYGPFTGDAAADAWITRCQDAAANGWTLLQDASYLIHRAELPFDPDALWEHGTDAHTTAKEN